MCRVVWNVGLEQRRAYRSRNGYINYVEQARQVAEAKADHPWLKAAPSHCLQQVLRDLEQACKAHGTFNVNMRKKFGWSPSFRFPEGSQMTVERLNRRWAQVKLPKLGWVRFRWTRALDGVIRSATVSRDGNHWYIAFLVDTETSASTSHAKPATAIGVDRGVKVAAACSDGNLLDRFNYTPGERKRYRRLEQQQARRKAGSRNRCKTARSRQRIKRRERMRRADFCAQTASLLTHENAVVVLEDLKIVNMTASARGSVREPGRNVAQKAGLNRAILDKGWYMFELSLRNAARGTGTRIVKVPAAYTSVTCSRCRSVDPKSRKSQAQFRCTSCGHSENADVNAAKNILAAGLAVTACGDLGTPGP